MKTKLLVAQLVTCAALLGGCHSTASSPAAGVAPTTAPTAVTDPAAPATAGVDKCNTVNQYDIPAGRFDATAQALAHATGCFIETDLLTTGAVPVAAVHGKMTLREAVRTAISGTQLALVADQPGLLRVGLRK